MKNLIQQFLYCAFILATLSSCSKKKGDDPTPLVEKQTDVYVAGYIEVAAGGTTMHKATIWKNGVAQHLSNSESWVNKVLVVGNDVYAVGREYSESLSVAKLWKNGIATNPINSSINTEAQAIGISASGDVYLVIREWSNTTTEYKVLKNGAPVALNLSNSNNRASPFDVFVSGNDVYIAGTEYVFADNSVKAVLWKNGIPANLPAIAGNDQNAVKVFVSGVDVYVVGTEARLANRAIVLWKNGVPVSITDGTKYASVNALFVSGGDVYVVGDEYNETSFNTISTLWKNGTPVFSKSEDGLSFNSVSVLNNDVYLTGTGFFNGSVAYLWKNGDLQTPAKEKASASSVFVIEK